MRQYGATDQLAPTQMGGAKVITIQFSDTAVLDVVPARAPRALQYGESTAMPVQYTTPVESTVPGSRPVEQQQQRRDPHEAEKIRQQQMMQIQM